MDKAAVAPVGLWFVSEVPEMDVSISVIQVVSLMWVMLKATESLAGVAMSGPRACELVRTPAELSEEELLSEDRDSASVEVCAKVKRSSVIFLASSELSSVQRVSKMTSMGSLTVPGLTVIIPVLGLPLVAQASEVSVGMGCTAMKLEGILISRVVASVTEEMVWVFWVNSTGKMVWFFRASFAGEVVWVSRVDAAGEVVWVFRDDASREVV